MSGSLKFSIPALTNLTDKFLTVESPTGSVDHLLILADALAELACEQHLSGLTISAGATRLEASRLREAANSRQKPSPEVPPEAAHGI